MSSENSLRKEISLDTGMSLIRPLQVGNILLPSNLVMAPLAGTTSAPFRALCHRFGVGLTVTELVSARGILYDKDFKKNVRYLTLGENEHPAAVQLFGSEPEDFVKAIGRLANHPLYHAYDLIDINMGCPVKKVMKTGAGAALMGTPEKAARIVEAAVKAAGKPVTVKFRSGLSRDRINAKNFAALMEKAGAFAITVHARTAEQMYAGQANRQVLAEVREAVTIPLFGNGDLASPEDIVEMDAIASVDGFAVGRAAVGRPWLFAELRGETVTSEEKYQVMIGLFQGLIDLLGERTAVREIRPQLAAMVRGAKDASHWRKAFFSAKNREDVKDLLYRFWFQDRS
jgi:tRNA-dihydrouridine synthase B